MLDAAVEQSRARISNTPGGRGPAIGRGPVGERRPTQQADPADGDLLLPPPPGDAAMATATAESGVDGVVSGGVDAAELRALMQQMSVGVSSLNARLGVIESRMDGRGQQLEQGSGGGGCCQVSASGSASVSASDAADQPPPARAPHERFE